MKDLKDAIEKGTKAWADVPDATEWVEELRGNRSQTKGEEHMKIYCELCKKVQPVQIDNEIDVETKKPYQDIVCGECNLVIASGTGIAQPKREWFGYTKEDRERIVPVLVQSLINQDDTTMALLLTAILIDIEQQLKEKNT